MPEDTRNFLEQPYDLIGEGQGWNNTHKTTGKPNAKIVCKDQQGNTVDLQAYDHHIDHEALAGAEIQVTNPQGKKNAWWMKRGDKYAVYAYPSAITVDGKPFKDWAQAHSVSASVSPPGQPGTPFPGQSGSGPSVGSKRRVVTLSEHRASIKEAAEFHMGQNMEVLRSHFEPEITSRVEVVAAALENAFKLAIQESIMLDKGTIKDEAPSGDLPF